MASTVATSLGLRKYQPRGLIGLGGSPAKGDQGSLPEIVRAAALSPAAKIGSIATVASRRRRLTRTAKAPSSPGGREVERIGILLNP